MKKERIHPYFTPNPDHNPIINPMHQSISQEYSNIPESTSEPAYIPKMACVSKPMWMQNAYRTEFLNSMFSHDCYSRDRGNYIDSTGHVCDDAGDARSGIIRGMAISIDTDNHNTLKVGSVNIINTEDAGLRYVHCSKYGTTIDIGPVEHVCVVGNDERPEGIYVPICNTKAMADSIILIDKFLKDATVDDSDLLDEDYDEWNDFVDEQNQNSRQRLEAGIAFDIK